MLIWMLVKDVKRCERWVDTISGDEQIHLSFRECEEGEL